MCDKNKNTAKKLATSFENNEIEKTYQLICRGWSPPEGLIDHALTPKSDFTKSRGNISEQTVTAKEAQTEFKTLETFELEAFVDRYPKTRYSYVEAHPKTGRKHQIRRHFKHIGHPLVGDAKHGKSLHNRFFESTLGESRLYLHASALRFLHPSSAEPMYFKCQVSGLFFEALDWLRRSS